MPKTITVDLLSQSSISKAIEEIEQYKRWVNRKSAELAEALSRVGIYEASIRFAGAQYDGLNDVYVETTKDNTGSYVITAHGKAVAFIEFGAGVYHNTTEYPLPRPAGIVGIGEYGRKHGKRRGWAYPIEKGLGSSGVPLSRKWAFTRGNPRAMPMYYASKEMQEKLLTVAREVFGN